MCVFFVCGKSKSQRRSDLVSLCCVFTCISISRLTKFNLGGVREAGIVTAVAILLIRTY